MKEWLENIKDKKIIYLMLVGVLTLVLLTFGATYAYFTVTSGDYFGNSKINATVEPIGSGVVFSKLTEGIKLDVTAMDMLIENAGTYYASGSIEPEYIGKIAVIEDGKYNCTYTMEIINTTEGEDMYERFQNFEDKSEGQIYLTLNEQVYDFNTENLFNEDGKIVYNGVVRNITYGNDVYITSNIAITNSDVIDQTELNKARIDLKYDVTSFQCDWVTDNTAPESLAITLADNSGYTNKEEIDVVIEWDDEDVESYCITENEYSANCEWQPVTVNTYSLKHRLSTTYKLSSGDGEKKVYLYLKDGADNVSKAGNATIILDTQIPIVTASINNNNTSTPTMTITSNESGTYCVNTSANDTTSCKFSGSITSGSITTSAFTANGTYYAHVTDSVGNIGHSDAVSVVIKHTVNVSSTNKSYGTVSPASQSINHGSAATITIIPNTGYKYSSNTCGVEPVDNVITLSNVISDKECTVTFAEDGTRFGQYLISAKTAGWNSTAYGGMYRYIGTTANNYVKLGDVLYRVIGVTSAANSTLGLAANQVKVIKAATIGNHNWYPSYSVNATWNTGGTDAAMYTYLQNDVLSNTSYIPSGWSSKISSVKWNVGDVPTSTNGDTVYGQEDNIQTTNTSKVGLMYLSDYYYAYNAGGTTNCLSTACTNWLTDTSNNYTWTMSRYGYHSDSGTYHVWAVRTSGRVDHPAPNNVFAFRPVFYLSASVNWKSGTGASGDPFIIE